jgi:hypothetical protein
MSITVFWLVMPCGLVDYQSFGGTYCLHLQGEVLPPASSHGITTQKTMIDIFTTVRTSNKSQNILFNVQAGHISLLSTYSLFPWIHVAQDSDHWRADVNKAINHRVP